ncbi:MAG: hypothetical protein QM765_46530 [Myxococcales bacterium]
MTDFLKLRGELALPPVELAAWLESSVEGAGGAVSGLFDELAAEEPGVTLQRTRLRLRIDGVISDPGSALFWPRLEAALRAAAERGAEGRLALESGPYRCVMEFGRGKFEEREERVSSASKAPDPKRRVPGVIEPAASGRAACRGCRTAIAEGELRFGEELVHQSTPGHPKYHWYHLRCAARALPYSFGPVLKSCPREIAEREALLSLLPADAIEAPAPAQASTPASTLRGQRVRILETAKEGAGREGEVVWHGRSKYGDEMRVGVKDEAGTVHWVDEDQVQRL